MLQYIKRMPLPRKTRPGRVITTTTKGQFGGNAEGCQVAIPARTRALTSRVVPLLRRKTPTLKGPNRITPFSKPRSFEWQSLLRQYGNRE
jgi:hypothetical protein